jgi:hypothetical protein
MSAELRPSLLRLLPLACLGFLYVQHPVLQVVQHPVL